MTRIISVRSRTARTVSAVLLALLLSLMTWWSPVPASAQSAPAVNQCNGTDNVGGDQVECDVTIVNTLNVATGIGSSTVTLRECHGAANAPPTCTTTTSSYTEVVTSVTQCDGSGNGGGGEVQCSVSVTNNIVGTASPTSATVNQCIGSGEDGGTEPTIECDPVQQTTGATVTQCNGSGNGGGASVTCTTSLINNVSAAPTDAPTTAAPTATSTTDADADEDTDTDTTTTTTARRPGVRQPAAAPPATQLPRTGPRVTVLIVPALTALLLGCLFVAMAGQLPSRRGAHRQ